MLSRVREAGSMVSASTPVLTLNLRDPVYVRAYVDEPDLGRIAPGAAVTLQTDSSKRVYHGRIGFIASQAEFTSKIVDTAQLRTDLAHRVGPQIAPGGVASLNRGTPRSAVRALPGRILGANAGLE